MTGLDWPLGPIAHRGLHNSAIDLIENTPSAVEAALVKGYGVEVDVQCAKGDVPVVFHDPTLDRLMQDSGAISQRTPKDLARVPYKFGSDRIISLCELFDLVAGRAPIYVEIKSNWSGDVTLAREAALRANQYFGPVALMSFDPKVVSHARRYAPHLPIGLVSGRYCGPDWPTRDGTSLERFVLRHLFPAVTSQVNFINYEIAGLPALTPIIARRLFSLPLLTWTVRTQAEREIAARWADAIVFENFEPDPASGVMLYT